MFGNGKPNGNPIGMGIRLKLWNGNGKMELSARELEGMVMQKSMPGHVWPTAQLCCV